MQNFLKLINKLFVVGLLIVAIIKFNVQALLIILLAFVPFLLKKIFKYKASEEMKVFYYSFVVIAYICGVVYKMYHTIWWMDLFAHFLSGIFFTMIGFYFIKKFKVKQNPIFVSLFLLGFGCLIAFLWEAGEYTYDTLFDKDTQWVKETGVADTMDDMLIATAGSIIVTGWYIYAVKKDGVRVEKRIEHLL